MKVVSRGNPQVSDVGNLVKDRERGGRPQTVRHEHLLGLIGRSHFPARAQAEEREERRWLDFYVNCKKESRITESDGQIVYI